MPNGTVHRWFDWQQSVVRCSDNRDETIDEVVEPIPDHGNEEHSAGKTTVPMDAERLKTIPKCETHRKAYIASDASSRLSSGTTAGARRRWRETRL